MSSISQMTPFVDGRQVDLYSLYKDVEDRGPQLFSSTIPTVCLYAMMMIRVYSKNYVREPTEMREIECVVRRSRLADQHARALSPLAINSWQGGAI